MHGLERKKFKSAFLIDKLPSWGEKSGEEDGVWFDLPKVWDPLSSSRNMEEVYVLPEIQSECNGANDLNEETTKISDVFTEFQPNQNEERDEESSFLRIDPSFDSASDHQKKRKKLMVEKPPKQKLRKKK
jgi:hypothetical protein